MKQIITLFTILASLNILALDSNILFEKTTNKYLDYDVKFEINKNLGRAWLVITEINDFYDEETYETEYRVNVEGLAFNKSTNEIVLTGTDKSKTTCAFYTSKRGIFGYSRLTTTNDCLIEKKFYTEEYDNGFNISKRLKVQFSLRK